MSRDRSPRMSTNTIRWIARLWSLLVLVFVLLRIFTPDPFSTEPISLEDQFFLSLWGIALLGVLLGWRWPRLGAIVTIGTLFLRELIWVLLKGGWLVNFLLIWAVLVPPAILFLLAQRMERKTA